MTTPKEFVPTTAPAEQVWRQRLAEVLADGYEVAPRGLRTLELLHPGPLRLSLRRPVVVEPLRGLNYGFMATEPLLALAGDNTLAGLRQHIRGFERYSDDGETLSGAYGPPVVDQLPWCVRQLLADRATRQAVLTIWRPRPGPSKDVPCAVSLGFNIRGPYLNALVHMRASDVWLGCPYDLFTFAMIAWRALLAYNERVSADARVGPGQLAFVATNAQVYEEHLERARAVDARPEPMIVLNDPTFDLADHATWAQLEGRLRAAQAAGHF